MLAQKIGPQHHPGRREVHRARADPRSTPRRSASGRRSACASSWPRAAAAAGSRRAATARSSASPSPRSCAGLEELKARGMQDCFKLLHFHLGSQITNIRIVKGALNEAARVYAELAKPGAGLEYIDVGGGLGVDYDGSQTNFESSVNYTLAGIRQRRRLPHPDGVRRSRRAAPDDRLGERPRRSSPTTACWSSTCSGVSGFGDEKVPDDGQPDECEQPLHRPDRDLPQPDAAQRARELPRRAAGARHGAQPVQRRLPAARAAQPWPRTCSGRSAPSCRSIVAARWTKCPRICRASTSTLSDTYFCNFSLFQSIPDSWAIKQLFPVMPIHRLNEQPTQHAVLGDITCDSDGKIDQFIDRRDVKRTLPLHAVQRRAVLPRRVPGRRVPGDPRRPAQPVRRHARRARQPRRRRQRRARRGDQGRHGPRGARLRRVRRRDAAAASCAPTSRPPSAKAASTTRSAGRLLRFYEDGLHGYTYLEG